MKNLLFGILTGLFVLLPTVSHAKTDDDPRKKNAAQSEYITPGWVVVKFKEGFAVSAGAGKTGVSAVDVVAERFEVQAVEKMFPFIDGLSASKAQSFKGIALLQRVFRMKIDEQRDPRTVAAAFNALDEVAYAEPMYREKIITNHAPGEQPFWNPPAAPIVAIPNDPTFSSMTHLTHVMAPEAWDVVKGEDGDVVVAIIDGGTDWNHPDLVANIWTNPGEIPDNGIDDDGNDFIDDVHGWNFANDSGDPTGLPGSPNSAAHGTITAGIVAAETNNGTGISGVSWNATIMPINISCGQAEEDGRICYTLSGILYAALNGADIVSASIGGPTFSFLGQDIVNVALENETLIIAAAGNDRLNNDIIPQYPADYQHALSVGATNKNFDTIANFSNYGISVDIYAPGVSINSTMPNNRYTSTADGTSFATPLIAGVAALVKTLHPDWTVAQVREQVRATADDISARTNVPPFRGKVGKGRLNAFRAVSVATPSVRVASAEIVDGQGSSRLDPGEQGTVLVNLTNFLEPVSNLNVTLESTSNLITVLTPTANLASLNPGDTSQVAFEVVAAASTPFNLDTNLNVRFSSGDYFDVDGFALTINSTIHETGVVDMHIAEDGNLGWADFQGESAGTGFRFLGEDYLFEGGIIMGNTPSRVVNNVRGEGITIDDDFSREEGSDYGIIDGRETFEEGALQLVDDQASIPLKLRVNLDSYADTSEVNNDFIILKYTIENTSVADMDNFHMGLFFDWDSPGEGAALSDYARYDEARQMGIFQNVEEGEGVYIATKLLSNNTSFSFRAIKNSEDLFDDDGFSKAEKWNFISGGVQVTELDTTDISILVAGGIDTLPADGSAEFAFALVTGITPEAVRENADNAQQLWDEKLSGLSPNPVPIEDAANEPAFTFALHEPYPNPVQGEATITYQLPSTGEVVLKAYDMLGREVRTLVEGIERAGNHSLTWDARDNAGLQLASGVYMITLQAPANGGLKTATQKVVVVR